MPAGPGRSEIPLGVDDIVGGLNIATLEKVEIWETQINKHLNYITMAFKGAIDVDSQKCKGCGVCVENCPTKSIELSKLVNNKGYHYAEMVGDACIGCSNCAIVCPDSVITVYRVKI